jgi:hypothetical protein
VLGALVLLGCLFVSWYDTSYQVSLSVPGASASGTAHVRFYAGDRVVNTTTLSCSGAVSGYPGCGKTTSNSSSYSTDHLDATGRWYTDIEYMVIVGFVLGIVAGLIALAMRGRPGSRGAVVGLGVVAFLLALAAPLLLLVFQPGALSADHFASSTNGPGPWSSFFGSCSGNGCFGGAGGGSAAWGPSYSWYGALLAFFLLLIGVGLYAGSAGVVAAAPVAATTTTTTTQATSPPTEVPMTGPAPVVTTPPGTAPVPAAAGGYVCPRCGMSFATSDELAAHARVHDASP